MSAKMVVSLAVLAIVLCAGLALCTNSAYAQSADQKLAERTGLGNKEFDKSKMPGKLEVGLGFGSIFVMIAVMKWL